MSEGLSTLKYCLKTNARLATVATSYSKGETAVRSLRVLSILVLALAGTSFAQTPATTEMVTIPAGPFTMGSDNGPMDERPAHTVALPAFSIDRNQVTNSQFANFL